MNVLVTGGAGFIGSNIVDVLIKEGHRAVVIDNLSSGYVENLNDAAVFYEMDIADKDLSGVMQHENISHIIHHAAQIDVQKSIENPFFDLDVNIRGTVHLLECCRQAGVKKIIYASSAAVYGEPDYLPVDEAHPFKAISPYGISKYTGEQYIKFYASYYGLCYTIFRYANVYGPRQNVTGEGGVVSIFTDKMLRGETPVIYGDGEQTRDFIYVGDIAAANVKALSAGDNSLLNISTASAVSVNELHAILNRVTDRKIAAEFREARSGDIRHSSLSNKNALKILAWKPDYGMEQGLAETAAYYAAKNNKK